MRTITYGSPINDTKMTYDYENHRYILNPNYVKTKFKIDGNISDELLDDVSDNVYLFIYSHKTGQEDYDKMEYELARNHNLREWLFDALVRQFQYAYTTNGDTVSLQHGVDLSNNKTLTIKELRNELFIAYKAYMVLYIHGFLKSSFENPGFDYTTYRSDY